MRSFTIPIKFIPGNRWINIRELCGKDEQSINGTCSVDAIHLLDRITVNGLDSEKIITDVKQLPVSDRDTILGVLYSKTYGDKIASTITCPNCGTLFDIDFSLKALSESVNSDRDWDCEEKDGVLIFKSKTGYFFRVPTGEDEISCLGLEPKFAEEQLIRCCLQTENVKNATDSIQEEMQQIAPLLDSEIIAQCPECKTKEIFNFNIQHYLLSSLIKEQKRLVYEVHLLATNYSWGLNEILDLPRSIRHSYVSLINS